MSEKRAEKFVHEKDTLIKHRIGEVNQNSTKSYLLGVTRYSFTDSYVVHVKSRVKCTFDLVAT